MSYSKMTQLTAASWLYDSNRLLTSYRDYTAKGTIPSKSRLALNATIAAANMVGSAILAALGLVLSLGKNRAWPYVTLTATLASASFAALFNFTKTMEQLRLVEAQAFCRERIGLNPDSAISLSKQPVTPSQIDAFLLSRLGALDATQLAAALAPAFSKDLRPQREFLDLLYRFAQQAKNPLLKSLTDRIEEFQKQLYRDQKLIVCCEQKDNRVVPFLCDLEKVGKAMAYTCPEVRLEVEIVEKSAGKENVFLKGYQTKFFKAWSDLYTLDVNPKPEATDPITPSNLEQMALYLKQQEQKEYYSKIIALCEQQLYSKDVSKEGLTTLENIARLLDAQPLLVACLAKDFAMISDPKEVAGKIQQIQALPENAFRSLALQIAGEKSVLESDPAFKTKIADACLAHPDFLKPVHVIEMAKAFEGGIFTPLQIFNILKNPELPLPLVEACLNKLLSYPEMEWYGKERVQMGIEADPSEDAAIILPAIAKLTSPATYYARFIELSLNAAKGPFFKQIAAKCRLDASVDARLKDFWDTIHDGVIGYCSMVDLFSLSLSSDPAHPGYVCPQLGEAILATANDWGSLGQHVDDCQKVLLLALSSSLPNRKALAERGVELALKWDLHPLFDTCAKILADYYTPEQQAALAQKMVPKLAEA